MPGSTWARIWTGLPSPTATWPGSRSPYAAPRGGARGGDVVIVSGAAAWRDGQPVTTRSPANSSANAVSTKVHRSRACDHDHGAGRGRPSVIMGWLLQER